MGLCREGKNIERTEMRGSPVGGAGLQLISFSVLNWISGVFKTGLITGYVAPVLSVLNLRVNSSKATSTQQGNKQYVSCAPPFPLSWLSGTLTAQSIVICYVLTLTWKQVFSVTGASLRIF